MYIESIVSKMVCNVHGILFVAVQSTFHGFAIVHKLFTNAIAIMQ